MRKTFKVNGPLKILSAFLPNLEEKYFNNVCSRVTWV